MDISVQKMNTHRSGTHLRRTLSDSASEFLNWPCSRRGHVCGEGGLVASGQEWFRHEYSVGIEAIHARTMSRESARRQKRANIKTMTTTASSVVHHQHCSCFASFVMSKCLYNLCCLLPSYQIIPFKSLPLWSTGASGIISSNAPFHYSG